MLTCGTLINRNYQTSSIFIFILFFCSCSPKQDSISHRTRVLQNRKPILIVRTYTFFSIIYNQKLLYIRARRKKSLISLSFFSKIPVLFFYNYEKITINLGPLSCLVYLSFMTNTSPIYFTLIFFLTFFLSFKLFLQGRDFLRAFDCTLHLCGFLNATTTTAASHPILPPRPNPRSSPLGVLSVSLY